MDTPAATRDRAGPRRRALVTGASAGIGAAFAEGLAREQYDLTLVARRAERLEELAKELRASRGVAVEVLRADLTQPADLAEVVGRLEASVPDLLVNNAGVGSFGPFAHLDAEREIAQVQLNVVALVRLTRAALPGMIERGRGAVINVSSMAGFQPTPYNATYGGTKAFVNAFTEALHEELRGTGVRVQVLCPGFTRTEFAERAGAEPDTVPGFAWMEADAVVEASLKALAKGELVCVPGLGYRALAVLGRAAPHALSRRLLGRFTARGLVD